jgi:hypothetical protein
MARETSSAQPQALFHYTRAAEDINSSLVCEAEQLAATLDTFHKCCTEPTNDIGPALADRMRQYVNEKMMPKDEWVEQVGRAFQLADSADGSTRVIGLALLQELSDGSNDINADRVLGAVNRYDRDSAVAPALQADKLKAQGWSDEEIRLLEDMLWLRDIEHKPWLRSKPDMLPDVVRMRMQASEANKPAAWSTLVVFDGSKVILVDPDGNEIARYRAGSGIPGFTDTSLKDKGPIPEGAYRFVKDEGQDSLIFKPGFWQKLRGHDYDKYGTYRAKLQAEPGTDAEGRTGIYIHGGYIEDYISAGCIDVGKNDEAIFAHLKNSPEEVRVLVSYEGA